MNSTLKYGLLIALVLAIVFGLTLINQYASGPVTLEEEKVDPKIIVGVPLRFVTTKIAYAPTNEDLSARHFTGFFEVGETTVPVSYWFQNPHALPVQSKVLYRSCSTCTDARIGTVPDVELKNLVIRAAVGSLLSMGSLSPPDLMAPMATHAMVQTVQWQNFDFDDLNRIALVPPAASDGTPTWGLFQAGIKIRGLGPVTRQIDLALQAGDNPHAKLNFLVGLAGVNPFDVTPKTIAFGDLPEGTSPKSADIFYWSATRDFDALLPPSVAVTADPFVQVSPPVRMTPAEMAKLVQELGTGMKLVSGYKLTITAHRSRPAGATGPAEPDIGPLSRTIGITAPGTSTSTSVLVTGMVTGLVTLVDGTTIDLGSFDGRFGTTKTVTLVSDRPGLSLEVASPPTLPAVVNYSLTGPISESGRTFWTLKMTVPELACQAELPSDAVLAFVAKTPDGPRTVRIPIKGRGYTRNR